jgi:hypothetical protein
VCVGKGVFFGRDVAVGKETGETVGVITTVGV